MQSMQKYEEQKLTLEVFNFNVRTPIENSQGIDVVNHVIDFVSSKRSLKHSSLFFNSGPNPYRSITDQALVLPG